MHQIPCRQPVMPCRSISSVPLPTVSPGSRTSVATGPYQQHRASNYMGCRIYESCNEIITYGCNTGYWSLRRESTTSRVLRDMLLLCTCLLSEMLLHVSQHLERMQFEIKANCEHVLDYLFFIKISYMDLLIKLEWQSHDGSRPNLNQNFNESLNNV